MNSPRARHRRRPRRRASSRTRTRSASRSGRSPPCPEAVPGLGAGRGQGARPLHVDRWSACASAPRRRDVGDLLEETLAGDRLPRGARGRAHDRGAGPAREPPGAGRRRARVRRERGGRAGSRLAEFLQQLSLFSEQDDLRDDEGIVTLMTLHNAKGLEYPVVFMIGCEEGVFPHSRSIEAGDLEEERRLCYVGITRAKRQLYLTYARTRSLFGARDWNMPQPLPRRDPGRADRRARSAHAAGRGGRVGRAAAPSRGGARRSRRLVPRRRRRRPRAASARAS